jgi:hypothetical protein
MQITNDLDFKKYVHEYFDMDSDGDDTDEDDSSYFSDDDIPSDETEEVDDDYFNMHLMACNIEYGQWLALQLVKSEMGRGWHWGW